MTVFMTLGEVAVELLSSPTAFSTRSNANYSEQTLIGRKSTLQHTGFTPDDVSVSVRLHRMFCDPAEEYQRLAELKDKKTVFPLVFASGEYRGTFVLKSVDETLTETTASGETICSELSLALAEYIGDPAKPNPPGVRQPASVVLNTSGIPLSGVLPAPPASLWDDLQAAAQVVGQVGEAAARVNDIAARAANGDVLGAIGLAGAYAPQLTEMAALLPVEAFQDLEQVKTLAVDAGAAAQSLATTRNHLSVASGLLESGSTLSAFSSASDSLASALTAANSSGPALARLDAYAQVGSRLTGILP